VSPARRIAAFLPYFLCVLCVLLLAACGRKGPPLAPLVRLPGPVVDLSAKRLGDEIVLQFTIPSTNTDNSRPADLDRVEVYAHTGPLPAPADFPKYGTLVANITVKPPPGASAATGVSGLEQGAKAGASEKITPALMTIGQMPVVRNANLRLKATVEPVYETPDTVNAPVPVIRYYVTVGISRKNRKGAFSAPLPVPLLSPMAAPETLQVQYTQSELSLSWPALPRDEDIFVPAPVYNIYEIADTVPPKSEAPATTAGTVPPGAPLPRAAVNPAPLAVPEFKQPQVEFGVRRCYVVRAVRTAGIVSIESEPSPPACITPVDTFPPEAPRQLVHSVSENSVSLIWEPNTDKDLAGYLVLRGDTNSGKLTPLTPTPIRETTYRDTTVQPGSSYDYVVVAVDNAPTPNLSEYSNRITAVVP
jgi:hypothetical protein